MDRRSVLSEDASEAAGPNYAVVIRDVDGTLPVQLGEGSAGSLSPDGKWALSMPLNNAAQLTSSPRGLARLVRYRLPGSTISTMVGPASCQTEIE